MDDLIINKVTESALVTLDLSDYFPGRDSTVMFDLKPFLFMELVLRERDFREALKNHDWTAYEGKYVGVTCSADAIIPVWAYMLAAAYLEPLAEMVCMATESDLAQVVLLNKIRMIDALEFLDKRVVVKGCGELPISEAAYLEITSKLRPVAKSIMYGEPCSTVPIYKRKS